MKRNQRKIQIFIKDKKGNLHCLHADPTIDCLDDKTVMTYNATLIPDENINYYKNTQDWNAQTNSVWVDFYNGVSTEKQSTNLEPSFMDKILGTDRLERIRPALLEISDCMQIDNDGNLSTKDRILELYGSLYDKYQQAKSPIDNEEFLAALINVQKAFLTYNTHLSQYEINEEVKKILRERIQYSTIMQRKNWSNDCKKSFITDIINGEFDYEEELEKCTSLTAVQVLGREVLEELVDIAYQDETEKQEQKYVVQMQSKETLEK